MDNLEAYVPMVQSIVNGFYIPQGLDRDDLVQAGLIGIWKAHEKYNAKKNVKFSTYSYVSARNEILMMLRKHKKYQEEFLPLIDQQISTQDGIEKVVFEKHIKEDLEKEERLLIDLLYQGYTQREIAKVLKTSQPRICQRIRRLRVKGQRKWGSM